MNEFKLPNNYKEGDLCRTKLAKEDLTGQKKWVLSEDSFNVQCSMTPDMSSISESSYRSQIAPIH